MLCGNHICLVIYVKYVYCAHCHMVKVTSYVAHMCSNNYVTLCYGNVIVFQYSDVSNIT